MSVPSIKRWRVTLGAAGGLAYVTLRKSGSVVTVSRNTDGGGGDETTREVWSGLSDAETWFVTEWVLGRQDARVAERRHPRPSASSVTFTSPLEWNDAYSLRALHCPNT